MTFLSRLRRNPISNGKAGVVDVGWLLLASHAAFIWDAPSYYRRKQPPPDHAKSAGYCPAVIDNEKRLIEVACPFDLRLRMRIDGKGEGVLSDLAGNHSGMKPEALAKLVKVASQNEWRHPQRPIFQIKTPYLFLSDGVVYMAQLPPFLDYRDPPWPGTVIGGRLPIHIWPRTLNWAFEWYDVGKDLILTRGQPWFYCRFETSDPSRHVRLVQAQLTEELKTYLTGINGVAQYINKTFSLFPTARQRRPERLLVKVKGQKGESLHGFGHTTTLSI